MFAIVFISDSINKSTRGVENESGRSDGGTLQHHCGICPRCGNYGSAIRPNVCRANAVYDAGTVPDDHGRTCGCWQAATGRSRLLRSLKVSGAIPLTF